MANMNFVIKMLPALAALTSASADPQQLAATGTGQTESFTQLVNDLGMSLNTVRQKVDSWNKSQGLTGALGIQNDYPELLRRVNALRSASSNLAGSDINPQMLADLVNAMSGLLQSMAQKESDLNSVGAKSIGGDDIRELEQPTIDIITGVIHATSNDCAKLQKLDPIAKQAAQSFSSTFKTYGLQGHQFPVVPVCQGAAGGRMDVPVESRTPQPPVVSTSSLKVEGIHPNSTATARATTRTRATATSPVEYHKVNHTIGHYDVNGLKIDNSTDLHKFDNSTLAIANTTQETKPTTSISGPSLATNLGTVAPALKNQGSLTHASVSVLSIFGISIGAALLV